MTDLIKLQDAQPIFICSEATPMTLGIPGLLKKIEEEQNYKPYSKGIYVFISKDFARMKLLWWDRTGYALFYKLVAKGTFRVEWKGGYKAITGVKIRELLDSRPTGRIKK